MNYWRSGGVLFSLVLAAIFWTGVFQLASGCTRREAPAAPVSAPAQPPAETSALAAAKQKIKQALDAQAAAESKGDKLAKLQAEKDGLAALLEQKREEERDAREQLAAKKYMTDPLTGQELDIDQLFTQSGASMAGWNRRTREQALADVLNHVEDSRKKGIRVMTPGTALRWWNHFGEKAENIARRAEFTAAFRKGREKGYSVQDASLYAMSHARGLLDTAESGRTVGRLNRVFLFLNAAVKGLERTTKIARGAADAYRRGDTATGNRLAGTLAVRLAVWGGTLVALRMLMMSLLDDKDQEELMEQPAWKRDFSITLPDFGLGKIAIPKPYEWGFIGSGFERMADALWSTARSNELAAKGDQAGAKRWADHASRAADGYAGSGVTALLPLKFDDALGGGLAPVAEVAFNKSLFTGAPIVPQHEAGLKLDLRKHAADASALGRGIASVIPMDPRNVDHLIRGYLGGWGTTATAKDVGEVFRRFTGYSGESSPYAERDIRFVLDWADENGMSSRAEFAGLRKLAKAARDATGEEQDQKLVAMRRAAQSLRTRIEDGKLKPKP